MAQQDQIRISAIVSTYNREKYIPGLLNSLLKQTLRAGNFEIIIVDNNCTDRTPEICRSFIDHHPELKIKYIIEPQQGLSFARNCGIKNASSDIITFVDDDAYLSDNFLEVCADFLDKNTEVDAIGGKILLHYEGIKPDWVTVYHESLFGYFSPGNRQKIFTGAKYPRGSNMTFRKTAFEKCGLFNTELGRIGKNLLGAEEKDLFERLSEKKAKIVYVPKAVVYHFVPVERTTKFFVKKQALGIGQSERIRTISKSYFRYIKRILQEGIKWGGTLLMFAVYMIKIQPSKALMLLSFRYFISKGLLKPVKS